MMRSFPAILLLGVVFLAGCDSGAVPVSGTISLEGEPLVNGRIILSPLEKGPKAYGVLADGKFQLRCDESKEGAMPGSYRALVTYQPELSDLQKSKLGRMASGLDAAELTISHSSPKKVPIVIPEEGTDSLAIDIRDKDGWRKIISD